jgi:hypothetical protein
MGISGCASDSRRSGRQGLFAHDNTHHTMAMAYTLVDCLRADGALHRDAWARARKSFEDHVVED